MTTSIEKQGLSVNDTCDVSGLGKTKIYEAISAGQLVARKFGKRTIILREDLTLLLPRCP